MANVGVFVHPLAVCESTQVGPGTRIWPFAHVMAGAVIGRNCNVCGHAFIECGAVVGNGVTIKNGVMVWDRVTIEDDVFLGPGTVFTNDLRPRAAVKKSRDHLLPTIVRQGATIGAHATVICGVAVGENAMIGAGAVVTTDVRAHSLVLGNPARHAGWVCRCGETLGADLACRCGLRYRQPRPEAGLRPEVPVRAVETPAATVRRP